jgi:hypothetical protein
MLEVKGIPYYIYARICKVSYGLPQLRPAELQQLASNWRIIDGYSNNDILTVTNGNLVVIAFRGTELNKGVIRSTLDLYNDYGILTGENERVFRLQEARPVVQAVLTQYGRNNIVLTGHSLGGYIGVNLCEEFALSGVLFNIGSSPKDKKLFRGVQKRDDIVHITTNDLRSWKPVIDVLSFSSLFIYQYPYYIQKVRPGESEHTIDNFI